MMYSFLELQLRLGEVTLEQLKTLVGVYLTQAEYDKLSQEFK